MSGAKERERPSEEISQFHDALIKLLQETTHIEHRSFEDIAVFSRPFCDLTIWGEKSTGFGIYTEFPCVVDHERGIIPNNSKVLLGFITDPYYLAVDKTNAVLQDSNERKIKDADDNVINYYVRCVKAAIKSPASPLELLPFSDS